MNATIPFEIKDKSGNKVAAIAMEKMQTSISNSGVVSNYIYCILNIDKLVYYDTSKSDKLLICVHTKFKYSNMPRYSFYELNWQREQVYTLQKTFRGDNAYSSYEKW